MSTTSTPSRPSRLADLFIVGTHLLPPLEGRDDGNGRPVTFPAPDGTEYAVHVVKPNEKDTQSIERRALSAKARYLAVAQDRDSDEYQAELSFVVRDRDPIELIAYLVAHQLGKDAPEVEARHRHSKKWTVDHDYQALLEAWYNDPETDEPGLMWFWENAPEPSEDPDEQAANEARQAECDAVWKLIKEFHDELEVKLAEKKNEIADQYLDEDGNPQVTLEEVRHQVVDLAIQAHGDLLYLAEKLRQRLFYSVRQVGDWRKREFGTLQDVDDLPDAVKARLHYAYDEISVPDAEGKGSPGTPGSSPSSDPSDEEGSRSSGLEAASASRTSPTSS